MRDTVSGGEARWPRRGRPRSGHRVFTLNLKSRSNCAEINEGAGLDQLSLLLKDSGEPAPTGLTNVGALSPALFSRIIFLNPPPQDAIALLPLTSNQDQIVQRLRRGGFCEEIVFH
jgi:hypothetical protein